MKIISERIILITPPFTQLSSPYAAVPFLSGMLKFHKIKNTVVDLSIETAIRFFSKDGLTRLFDEIEYSKIKISGQYKKFFEKKDKYINSIDSVINFLQGGDPGLAGKISGRKLLPENKRFKILDDINIDEPDIIEQAGLIASLFIDDICDLARNSVLPQFGLSSYNERLAPPSALFDPIYDELKKDDPVSNLMHEVLDDYDLSQVSLAAITIPFPGNLFGALKTAMYLKKANKKIKAALGGGYVNTELKFLKEKRIFEFADFICHDNGEIPLLRLIDHIDGKTGLEKLVRTFVLENDAVVYKNDADAADIYGREAGYPDYRNIPLKKYFTVTETVNKMHRLWSEKGFVKLRMASGCYHHKCAFCDTKLQYICEYKPLDAGELVSQVMNIISETGIAGFHFIDEAMPPALIKKFCLELLKRKIKIRWWGNIRFEKLFDYGLCRLMKEAGCIAVTGGMEAANNRILRLMQKGITLDDSIKACSNFSANNILVHAYMIYGFPGETLEECLNSLEVIRQMFANKIVDSVYYHRFALTIHSPVHNNPEKFNIRITDVKMNDFANNDVLYHDYAETDIDKAADGLNKAVYNFNYGRCFDDKINSWFDFKVKINVPKDFVSKIINNKRRYNPEKHFLYLGSKPQLSKSGTKGLALLFIPGRSGDFEYEMPYGLAEWISEIIGKVSVKEGRAFTLIKIKDAEESFPVEDAQNTLYEFFENELWHELEKAGLIVV